MKRIVLKPIFMAFMLVFMLAATLFPTNTQAAHKPKINKTKATVYIGRSTTLKVKGTSGKVTWSTKNKKIATVSKSGKVTGKKTGKTTITAKVNKKSMKCKVTVKNPYLNAKSKTLDQKETFQLKLTGAKMKSCTSSDKKIASVTKSGKVTAMKAGKAVISVKASNRKVYKCTITVKDQEKDSSDGTDTEEDQDDDSSNHPNTGNDQPKDFSKLALKVYLLDDHCTYTGEAVEPDVKIMIFSNVIEYLIKDVDYTISYTNNVNVGKAQLTISGIGKYKGKITKEFEITKAYQDIKTDLLSGETVYIGKTRKINVSGAYGNLEFRTSDDKIVQIDSDGTITGLSMGQARIYLTASGDGNHNAYDDYDVGLVNVINEEASAYGFDETIAGGFKYDRINSRKSDGTNQYETYFMCDSDEKWLDKNITFQVEDVTPTAYANMFKDMGIAYEQPTVTLESADEYISSIKRMGYKLYVNEPYTEDEVQDEAKEVISGKYITIRAGAGVRAVKLIAKRGDHVLDYVYLVSDGEDAENNNSEYDLELYRQVRRKVEAQIWTDSMSNLEKLQALGNYIDETTHYPGVKITRKEYNPTFWKNWSVEGKELFLDLSHDMVLNKIMAFQGGITDCTAAGILCTAATEDLGLPYLHDEDTDTIASGEGVWVTSFASGHVTLEYKSADEETAHIDTQGQGAYFDSTPEQIPCEAHGCREKIISLK